jgi:hypothetical protein
MEQTSPAVLGPVEPTVRQQCRKHTPGPWMEHGPANPTADAPEGGDYCIQDGGTNVIAECFFRVSEGVGGTRNAEANAKLMAAAPDLADFAEWILEAYHSSDPPEWKTIAREARAVLGAAGCLDA